LTLTFKHVQARDQTRLPSEFGANPFSGSRDISYTNKKTRAKGILPNIDHTQAAEITARLQDLAHWHTTTFSFINLHIPHTKLSFSSGSFHTATPNFLSHAIYSSIRSTQP